MRRGVLAVFALGVAAVVSGCSDVPSVTVPAGPPSTPAPVTVPATTTTRVPVTTTTSVPAPTTTEAPPQGDDGTLRAGDQGEEVRALQGRLDELGYWPGPVDGTFGASTTHAVVALQKVAGLARDGVVGPATRAALEAGVLPTPRSTAGRVAEILLDQQVLVVVDDGTVALVLDTSTGRVPGTTPVGHWTVNRQIDGLRRSPLGLLYRPKYFHEGVAIHGYTSVPPYPASHGCVRVTYPAMDHLWASGSLPIGTPVWVR